MIPFTRGSDKAILIRCADKKRTLKIAFVVLDDLGTPPLRDVSSRVWRATLNTERRDRGVLPELRAAYFGHYPETNERYCTAGVDLDALAERVAGDACGADQEWPREL